MNERSYGLVEGCCWGREGRGLVHCRSDSFCRILIWLFQKLFSRFLTFICQILSVDSVSSSVINNFVCLILLRCVLMWKHSRICSQLHRKRIEEWREVESHVVVVCGILFLVCYCLDLWCDLFDRFIRWHFLQQAVVSIDESFNTWHGLERLLLIPSNCSTWFVQQFC